MVLWETSNLFKAGHRIRLEVTSSNFPRFDRNLNSGEALATGTRLTVAHQTIYHSVEYPSHVILPIISGWRLTRCRRFCSGASFRWCWCCSS